MINSRSIDNLHPIVQDKCKHFIEICKDHNIDILVTSTYRDCESQDELYAQGRTKPGKIVTNAKGGQSFHNWKVAFDVVPIINGKPVWSTKGVDLELWNQIGEIGEHCGLEWAGRWKKFKEMAHFQYTNGLTLKDFQSGKTL